MEYESIYIDELERANVFIREGKDRLKEILKENKISYLDYFFLYYIYKNPGETQYNIIKKILLDKPRANQITSKLVSLEYIEKKEEESKGIIKKPLYVTQIGKEVVISGLKIKK